MGGLDKAAVGRSTSSVREVTILVSVKDGCSLVSINGVSTVEARSINT